MSELTVADAVVKRLQDWGVGRIFGYSGDGINAFMAALNRVESGPEFIQARHEENAALMAVGQAKYAGGVGVVTSTQGPGAVHLLNGLYDAKLDSVPVGDHRSAEPDRAGIGLHAGDRPAHPLPGRRSAVRWAGQ